MTKLGDVRILMPRSVSLCTRNSLPINGQGVFGFANRKPANAYDASFPTENSANAYDVSFA
jgi:hypothetical protein